MNKFFTVIFIDCLKILSKYKTINETKEEMSLLLGIYDVEYLGKEAILYGTIGNKKFASIVDFKDVITN